MNVIIDRVREMGGELRFECCCQFEAEVVNISIGRSWALLAHPGEAIIEVFGQMDSVRFYEKHLHVFLKSTTRYNVRRKVELVSECGVPSPSATGGAA